MGTSMATIGKKFGQFRQVIDSQNIVKSEITGSGLENGWELVRKHMSQRTFES